MFTSNAEWPKEAYKGPYGDGISTDEHQTNIAAAAVCATLRRQGLGGEGKVFPIRTWVSKKEVL